jgi:GAF domain-containing protein
MTGDVEGSLADACADLARTMARPDAADRVLPGIAGHVATVLGARTTGVLLERAGGRIEVAASADGLVADLFAVEEGLGEGPTLDAFRQRTPALVHTLVDAGPTWPRWTPEARAHDVGAFLAVPSGHDDAAAVVCASSTRPRRWQDSDVAAAQVLADLAAGWVAHAHELDRVRRDAAQLQDALDHRLVIEQAKGIIAGELGCTVEQAFAIIRHHARRNNATVRSVAHAVVELGLRPPSPHTPEGVT